MDTTIKTPLFAKAKTNARNIWIQMQPTCSNFKRILSVTLLVQCVLMVLLWYNLTKYKNGFFEITIALIVLFSLAYSVYFVSKMPEPGECALKK